MSVDLGRLFPPAIRNDAPLQERYDHLKEQVDILGSWILNNAGDRIHDGGACELAVELLREWKMGLASEIAAEREKQDKRWGGAEHDDQHDSEDWTRFIDDHLAEYQEAALGWPKQENRDLVVARKALIQVAALAVAAIESLDRKTAPPEVAK